MTSNIQWYVAQGKTPIGPLAFEDLKSQVVDGALTMKTKVWHKELGPWAYANRVPEVAALIAEVRLEQLAKPRWMVVADKKVKRETEGPFSDNDIEAKLVEGVLPEKAIFWTKGQEGWLTLDKIKDLVEAKLRAEAAKAARPPAIEDGPDIPEIPDEDGPPAIHDDEEAGPPPSMPTPALAKKPIDRPFVPAPKVIVRKPTANLGKALAEVFAGSKWLPTVQVYVNELAKGIESGDAIKIDGAVDQIRLFLLREVQPDHSVRHPAMSESNLKSVSEHLHALVVDPGVKARVDKFDPFFSKNPEGAPSITATRTRSLLGAVAVKSFYPA